MSSRIKNSVVALVIGFVLGVAFTLMASDSKPPPPEAKGREAPSLQEVFEFARENLTIKNRKDGIGADDEFLKQHGLSLMSFIAGEPSRGTIRSASVLSEESRGEIRIRVFDSNGPGGIGYDFVFGDVVGTLRGFHVVYGH
ncbi:hypothetical protein V2O64_21475 [Verrucomicrobiaceae bacterium 227]